jgi:hypothetical protein
MGSAYLMARNEKPREAMQRRALSAMLNDAFFTWPSAVLIGFSIIATFLFPNIFSFWQPYYWIIFGAVAEAIYLWATVTDPVAAQQAVSRMLQEQYDPRDIRNQSARQRVQKALEYKRMIDQFVSAQTGAAKVDLSMTADEINDWIGLIYRLAKAIDTFEATPTIERDRRAVPTELENLKRRVQVETDPGVVAELKEAIDIRQQWLADLDSIANTIKRTDIQLDNTLAQLSRAYAQMQLRDTKAIDSGSSQRLRAQIKDEIASLADTVKAMDDVYNSHGYNTAVNDLAAESAATSASSVGGTENVKRASRGGDNA